MKVKELIEQLSELDPELEVYTASDDEGNSYNKAWSSPEVYLILADEVGAYRLDSVYTEEDWKSEQESGYIDKDEVPAKIVVL